MIVLDTPAQVEFLVGADDVAERVRDATVGRQLAAPMQWTWSVRRRFMVL